jgi:RimJ/RimL family protein N-acetyltransferase
MSTVIETARLRMRTWREEDAEPYYQINQDPRVTQYLLGALTIEQVEAFLLRVNEQQEKQGYTLWATELKSTGELIGFIGLNYTDFPAHFTPAVEIGWRLGSSHWGQGYATEGAKAVLEYGFKTCSLKEIVSFTVPENVRSIRVMEKIGLKRDPDGNFPYPKLPEDHPLSSHVLYRITREDERIYL